MGYLGIPPTSLVEKAKRGRFQFHDKDPTVGLRVLEDKIDAIVFCKADLGHDIRTVSVKDNWIFEQEVVDITLTNPRFLQKASEVSIEKMKAN
jgi:hypothetical protein